MEEGQCSQSVLAMDRSPLVHRKRFERERVVRRVSGFIVVEINVDSL